MSSEAVVVLILTALAVIFVVWVRIKSRGHGAAAQVDNQGDAGETSRNL